jgi:hypothetical protein
MSPAKPKLRKREILAALGAGVLAAGAAALVVDGMNEPRTESREVAQAAPDQMTYDLAAFEELSTAGPQDVVITIGEIQSVRAEGSDGVLGQLEAVVVDGRLEIRPSDGFRGNWGRLSRAPFYVTVPKLDRIALAGSGNISIDRIEGASFTSTIAGSGELTIASMDVEEADFSIAGGGDVTAAGTARETTVSIGGSGDIRATTLRSESADVRIAGSGDVALTVQDRAQVSIFGSGDVDISGPASCSVNRMGSGNVTCNGRDIEG